MLADRGGGPRGQARGRVRGGARRSLAHRLRGRSRPARRGGQAAQERRAGTAEARQGADPHRPGLVRRAADAAWSSRSRPTSAPARARSSTEAETVEADHIIVATGSKPLALPVPGADHPRVLDTDGALALTAVPSSIVVVGAGAVGCEWSQIFARLGANVTLVEMLPAVLPRADADVSARDRQSAQDARASPSTPAPPSRPSRTSASELEVHLSRAAGGTESTSQGGVRAGRRRPRAAHRRSQPGRCRREDRRQGLDRHRRVPAHQRPLGACHRRRDRPGSAGPRGLSSRDRGRRESWRVCHPSRCARTASPR